MILRTSSKLVSNTEHFWGLDPGKFGALACVSADGRYISVQDLPQSDEEWIDLLQIDYSRPRDYCTLENVHALPNQSTVAGFTFGKNVGKAELLAENLSSVEAPLLVTPQRWKKYFKLDKDKHKSVELAREMFPQAEELLLYSKDGRAEALLIAEYGRRYLKGLL